jgi:hypothetical protein
VSSSPDPARPPLPQPTRPTELLPGTQSRPTRTTRGLSWVGFHLGELAGVTVPGVLAFTTSRWFTVPSAVFALLWAAHEYRQLHHAKTTQGGDAR